MNNTFQELTLKRKLKKRIQTNALNMCDKWRNVEAERQISDEDNKY